MVKFLLIIAALFVTSFSALAQDRQKSIKFTDYDPEINQNEVFLARAKEFLQALTAIGKSTEGFVSVERQSDWAEKIIGLIPKDSDLGRRISFIGRGINYPGSSNIIEFWFIPPGADPPFEVGCALCECPQIDITGRETSSPFRTLTYTASITGGVQQNVTYQWKVSNGTITRGQNTPSIIVKPNLGNISEITVTLEVGGMDPECQCPTTHTFTTKTSPEYEPTR